MKVFVPLILLGHSLVLAGDIYLWVDDQGRRQLSDRPPVQSQGGVQKQDASRYELSPSQRQQAEDLKALDRNRLRALEEERRQAGERKAELPPLPARAASEPPPQRSQGRKSAEECKSTVRAYEESRLCYSQFVARGGIHKAGGFEKCGPGLGDPSLECGIAKNPPMPP